MTSDRPDGPGKFPAKLGLKPRPASARWTGIRMRLPSPPTPSNPARAEIRRGVWLDSRRALWFEDARRLVVADLHWGYSTVHQSRGNLLPCWGDAQIERTLRQLIADYRPREMIWLGDVVHAAEGAKPAERFLAASPLPVTVIAGNHDRRWRGAAVRTLERDGYFFHHGDAAPAVPPGLVEVIGHHHPAVILDGGAGARVKVPALVASEHRLVLPAFSPWSGGSPWPSAGESHETLWVVSAARVFALPSAAFAAR